jgi:hypothetical protein
LKTKRKPRQEIAVHAAVQAIIANHGRQTIDSMIAYLESMGFGDVLCVDPQHVKRAKMRSLMKRSRRVCKQAGEIAQEWLHLWDIDGNGRRVNYFMKAGECSAREAATHVHYRDGEISKERAERQRLYRFFRKLHGDTFVQELLAFKDDAA